jgi:hypothetical protein
VGKTLVNDENVVGVAYECSKCFSAVSLYLNVITGYGVAVRTQKIPDVLRRTMVPDY